MKLVFGFASDWVRKWRELTNHHIQRSDDFHQDRARDCFFSPYYSTVIFQFCFVLFIRLQAMKREIHLRELQLLDAVRRRFMHHQQTLKETELQRLDDEIDRKVSVNRRASLFLRTFHSVLVRPKKRKQKYSLTRTLQRKVTCKVYRPL